MKKSLNWLFDYPNLKVYQYEEAFKFSIDSILLFEYADIKNDDVNILDFCTGNAVIPILINYKYQKPVVGVEYQKEIFELAKDSVLYNHMGKAITLINDSVSELKNYFPGNNFDVILCNPPYFKFTDTSLINKSSLKSMARHEITITLEEIMSMASFLLKDNGCLYLVHIPSRIDEIFVFAHKYGMNVKNIRFVCSKENDSPKMVLVTCVKGGKFGVKVLPSVVIDGLNSYQGIFRK